MLGPLMKIDEGIMASFRDGIEKSAVSLASIGKAFSILGRGIKQIPRRVLFGKQMGVRARAVATGKELLTAGGLTGGIAGAGILASPFTTPRRLNLGRMQQTGRSYFAG